MGNTVLMRGETVTAFTQELFQKAGMSEPDAKYHAECLVNTNYWGIDSHGVIRVPAYFKRMLNGAINTNPQIKVVRGEGCLEVLDVDAAAGFIGGSEDIVVLADGDGVLGLKDLRDLQSKLAVDGEGGVPVILCDLETDHPAAGGVGAGGDGGEVLIIKVESAGGVAPLVEVG